MSAISIAQCRTLRLALSDLRVPERNGSTCEDCKRSKTDALLMLSGLVLCDLGKITYA